VVKKSSFLDKIVSRFRGGSVRVDSDSRSGTRTRGNGDANRVSGTDGDPAVVQPVREEIIPRSRRRMSPSEEAAIKMTHNFQELSGVLQGMQTRMEDQSGRLNRMDQNLARLPAAADAQIEVLQGLAGQIEKQNVINTSMLETFAGLPDVMKGVQASLEKNAVSDERTAQTLGEFKGTMDRVRVSMGDVVKSSQVQAEAATSLVENQQQTFRKLEVTTKEGLEKLRFAQEDQADRMTEMVDEHSRWNRSVLALLILSFAALVAIFIAVLSS